MEDLLNEAVSGSEDTSVTEKPVSIRDSLKAAMDETPDAAAPSDGRGNVNRDEAGRFATKTPDAAQQAQVATQPPVQAVAPDPAVVAAPVGKAPPGWSPEAKASFETLPPHVQAAVAKREQEVAAGFRVLQDYKGLEEFTPMVRQAGTSHADVMRRAVSWERSLQTNPINTVLEAARLGGVNIIELAQHLASGQIPQQQRQQQQPQVQPQDIQREVQRALHQKETERQLSEFFADPAHSHANDEAVSNHMAALIKAGMATSLKEAYEMATWARPDIRAQLINQQAPAVADPAKKAAAVNQARQAARSITGSFAPGVSQNSKEAPQDIRGSLRAAYRAATSGGSV
jgi:hypothetical protein